MVVKNLSLITIMAKGDHFYKGDRVYIKKGLIEHHGIDCGDGTVIHYRGKERGGRIVRTSYSDFREGQCMYVKPRDYKFSPNEIVRRAKKRLHEEEYNLLSNNCQHLGTYCTTGKSYSEQLNVLGVAASAASAVFGMLLGSDDRRR